jgi:nicotinamidase-related amidase
MKNYLLIIDPQNSFCDPSGELYVPGAEADMTRLAEFVSRRGESVDRIIVTLDSHNKIHISHPIWWADEAGNPPEPFTRITAEDLAAGKWHTVNPADHEWSLSYLEKISPHVIWPYHCLIGTWGHEVYPALLKHLNRWRDTFNDLEFIVKNSSRFTERFSAVRAAVEVPGDPSTRVNKALLQDLDEADAVWVAGEASSHCVADTVSDIVEYSQNKEIARKIVLLADAMSPVSGFEGAAADFCGRMKHAGVRILRMNGV